MSVRIALTSANFIRWSRSLWAGTPRSRPSHSAFRRPPTGHAGVVWIEGDAGFGKTALVRRVLAALPSDFMVMSAEADELAREQPFGVAVPARRRRLPPAHLRSGLELLRLTGERQDHRPVLVVVEDMHWADATSREALVDHGSPARRGALSHSC